MKFLFIVAQFYPSRGGVQTHTFEVGKRLVARGHEVVVITEGAEGRARDRGKAQGRDGMVAGMSVRHVDFGANGRLKKFRIWSRMMQADVRALVRQADVVVCHDVFFWYAPLRLLYPKKFVMTVFHGYETVFPPARKAIMIRRMSNWLSRRSIHVGSYIAKWYGTRADVTLTSGVRQADGTVQTKKKFQSSTQMDHPSKKSPLRIALVGRLADDMGIPIYVEAFSYLQKHDFPFQLDVCGDGPYRAQLEKFGTVHGFVADPSTFMRSADVVCASGYLSLMEALQLGKSCCAVYENELKKDYLQDSFLTEWIWIGNGAVELANYLMTPQAYAQRSQADSRRLQEELQHHSWDAVTDIYCDLCTQKR